MTVKEFVATLPPMTGREFIAMLPPADQPKAIDIMHAIADDWACLVEYIASDFEEFGVIERTQTGRALMAACEAGQMPSVDITQNVIGWVVIGAYWHRRWKKFTEEWRIAEAAAYRLSDIYLGPTYWQRHPLP